MPMGHGGAASFAARRAPVQAGHLCVGAGLVDEDQALGVEIGLSLKPGFARVFTHPVNEH